jgi:hypothetical protein
MDKSLWFIFNHKDSKKAATVAAQVSMVVQDVGHRRRFTPIIADGGPSTGPPCTFLILVDSDWSRPLKEVDSGLTLLLV